MEFVNSIKLYDRRPAPSTTWHSCRLDELVAQSDNLQRALSRNPHDASLSAALLIVEAERMSIEGMLRGSAAR